MKLDHINLDQLQISPLNVRKRGGGEVADLLPSIRAMGIIQPLLVRANCEGYEIIAGQRRYNALKALAEEGITHPVPCAIMEDGDDAAALEASLAENFARLPNSELDEYRAFADLIGKGMAVEAVAARFGVSERYVKQRMAIAGIIPPILKAYEEGDIRPDIIRALTLASKKKQKEWWKAIKSDDPHVPTHSAHHLKQWILGAKLLTIHALFDEAEYTKPIIGDLFGEERYFSDEKLFWELQNTAIAAKRDSYRIEGWASVHILEIGERWLSWEHVRVPFDKGGYVFIETAMDGEVKCHEGYLSQKDYDRRQKAKSKDNGTTKAARPELTQAMENYLGLHRHAAVQAELLSKPDIALRLSVAHMVAGSPLWSVKADHRKANNDAVAESVAVSQAVAAVSEEQKAVRELLGLNPITEDAEQEDGADAEDDEAGYGYYGYACVRDSGNLVPSGNDYGLSRDLAMIFDALMEMDDATVMRVLTLAIAESLSAHSTMVGKLGAIFQTDMRNWWQPETTFFDLLRDKEAINGMVREVSGENAADCNVTATVKVQKKIVTDCLEGKRTSKVANWIPRYLAFPAQGYTERFAPSMSVVVPAMGEDDDNLAKVA